MPTMDADRWFNSVKLLYTCSSLEPIEATLKIGKGVYSNGWSPSPRGEVSSFTVASHRGDTPQIELIFNPETSNPIKQGCKIELIENIAKETP